MKGDIAIDIKAALHIDETTAQACINLLEIYCNDKNKIVTSTRTKTEEEMHTKLKFKDLDEAAAEKCAEISKEEHR